MLEDLVKYHQVEYEFVDGYYFDEGRNTKINELIKHLFTQRLKFKKECNVIQEVYKLCMNSSYGKSNIKPIDTRVEHVPKKDLDKFLNRNHNQVKVAVKLHEIDTYRVELMDTIDKHFGNPHVGVEVLTMSKRLMNEVMCLAEDVDCRMYYTDTDSIHIANEDIGKLSYGFQKTYGRELIGNKMGQLHTDFELNGACGEIIATESIFLGKKVYYDRLKSVDSNGNEIFGDHFRMKGVSNDCIVHYAKTHGMTLVEVYEALENNQSLNFELTAVSPKFVQSKDKTIASRISFKRCVKFLGNTTTVE